MNTQVVFRMSSMNLLTRPTLKSSINFFKGTEWPVLGSYSKQITHLTLNFSNK